MNVADFNIEEWQKNCQAYDRNREGLAFDTIFNLTNGHLKIAFEKVDAKYIPALKNLATSCAQGAIIYMNQQFVPFYASDADYEKEYEHNLAILKGSTEEFLRTLFLKGFDSFVETVESVTTLQRIKYELNQVEFKDGKFVSKDGKQWNGQLWTEEGGRPVMNCISQSVWEAILPVHNKKAA